MNFLNQSYAQLVDLFRSMTPAARITAGLLLVVVVVSLAYLFQLQTSAGDEYLYGGREFSQSEIGDMEAAFAKAGLNKSQIVGNRVRVPRGQKDKYLAALADGHATPRNPGDAQEQASNSDNPFLPSRQADKKNQLAKQRELSLIISKMKGIRLATVQFDEIDKGFPKRKERCAMVAVQPEGNLPLDEERVQAIRTLVVGAIAGLEPGSVAVTDLGSGKTHAGVGPDGHSGEEGLHSKYKKRYESDLQRKIYDLLAMYPGVVVGVNVELNAELDSRKQSLKYDQKPIALSTTDQQKELTSTGPGPGGRPGSVSNGVGSNSPAQVASATGAHTQSTESRNEQKQITGHEQTSVQKIGLTPNRVTASIALPTSYFEKVWRELNPPVAGAAAKTPDPVELRKIEDDTRTKIESSVVRLLPPVERGIDPYPMVTVATYVDLPRAAETPPSATDKATTWLAGNWQTLALVAVGLFSLVMLRGMLRPGPAPTPAAVEGSPTLQLAAVGGDDETADDEAHPARKRRFRSSGTTLRDELTDMVKEDPDAAVNVLRNWIGDAA